MSELVPTRLLSIVAGSAMMALAGLSCAEMTSLTESELSEVEGAGIGLVLEDFKFAHGTDIDNGQVFKIGGIKSTDGQDVEIVVNKLYIAGSGSDYGANLDPVNLGRLVNPFTIDVIDGNTIGVTDQAVLSIAAPTKVPQAEGYDCLSSSAALGSGTCGSRPLTAEFGGERPDIGLQMNITVGSNQSANFNIHAQSAVIDGSYLRLWGDDERRQLVGQFKLNFYSPELSINACSLDGSQCGSRIVMADFVLELALGNELQPMFLDVDGTGNFIAEVQAIPQPAAGSIGADGQEASSDAATWNYYNDYYSNPDYRSNLMIGDLTVGEQNYGATRVDGMLIQYLRIQTKDLAQ